MFQTIQKSVSIFSFSWKAIFVRIIQPTVIDSENKTSHDRVIFKQGRTKYRGFYKFNLKFTYYFGMNINNNLISITIMQLSFSTPKYSLYQQSLQFNLPFHFVCPISILKITA